MGRRKIEHENKREKKKDFNFGGNTRRKEQSIAAFQKTVKEKRARYCSFKKTRREYVCE